MLSHRRGRSLLQSLVTLLFILQVAVGLPNPKPLSEWEESLVSKKVREIEERSAEIELEARQNSIFPVIGITGKGVSPRLNLRTLVNNNKDQWNLYVLGMRRFMNMNQNNKLSYYQISGIHGSPHIAWDGVSGIHTAGYCTHVSNLFLSWHRPYLALFEQALMIQVQNVVNQFPAAQRSRWQAAADGLRIPYWDWAAGPFPQALIQATVPVTTPSGPQTIPNPLRFYRFHPLDTSVFTGSFGNWVTTMRHPTSQSSSATSNYAEFQAAAENQRNSFRDRIYNLFTKVSSFTTVSTSATGPGTGNPNAHDSFESVHDSVHVLTGGSTGGHMSYVDYSSFDPAFWLHHTNVDRCMALWQILYPNSYVQAGAQTQDNWSWSQGQVLDANTGLRPFHKNAAGAFWSSNDVKSTTTFGYTYPELQNGATAASVKAAINSLYGAGIAASKFKRSEGASTNTEYLAQIIASKFALAGSFSIYFFFDGVPEDWHTWSTSSNLVGAASILAPVNVTDSHVNVSSVVPLTSSLTDKYKSGSLTGLDVETVTAWLKTHMKWVVLQADGVQVPAGDVDGLVISVVSQEVKPASTSSQFPTWVGGSDVHENVTDGKAAGLNSTDIHH